MTVTINVPPEVGLHLKGEAIECGLDVNAYATKLIVEAFLQKAHRRKLKKQSHEAEACF